MHCDRHTVIPVGDSRLVVNGKGRLSRSVHQLGANAALLAVGAAIAPFGEIEMEMVGVIGIAAGA